MADCCQVTTTVATQADAERIAAALVEERLAACVQVAGPIISTYRWQGAAERATEWYCHCKAPVDKQGALMDRIKALHPYEVPEIVAVRADAVGAEYLAWMQGLDQK